MELKTTKDFIMYLYDEVCNDLQKEIKREFPEAFPKVEVGNWYTINDSRFHDTFLYITDVQNNKFKSYGFIDGEWYDNTNNNDISLVTADDPSLRLATQREIEEYISGLFQKEAERRGLVEGVHIKSIWLNNHKSIFPLGANNTFYGNELANRDRNVYTLYRDGEWAEPVKGTVLKKRNAEIILSSLLGEEVTIK